MRDLDLLLDRTLDRVAADEAEPTAARLAEGRAELAAALAGGPATRKRRRWVAVAAAAVAVAVGGVLVQGVEQADTAAAASLIRAADLATSVTDQPMRPDQYRYVRSRYEGITLVDVAGTAAYEQALRNEKWIPAALDGEWLERQVVEGPATWLPGHEGTGTPGGPSNREGEFRAPCGNFAYFAADQPDRCAHGDWGNPTPAFLASLPEDPRALYDLLASDRGDGPGGVLMTARDALMSGRLPAAVRARLYRALALIPDLRVTEERANLDGRAGTALGVRWREDFVEVIVDPSNGDFIGGREVVAEDGGRLPRGTVRQSSSATTAVVDRLGDAPA
ncbi:CU044_5270 family protein [Saccharothrix obliqua]|uniref:CU044_5270 family protein n=1 Tax=Saccharothrix obliqua TaxID=2861747 RepID=UPI001C6044BA|nr:CU044_5270 family protein [Saccharothrix obliqua]MBW4717110.1 CU044_5270 family protein [Saccharothrix obliqua]